MQLEVQHYNAVGDQVVPADRDRSRSQDKSRSTSRSQDKSRPTTKQSPIGSSSSRRDGRSFDQIMADLDSVTSCMQGLALKQSHLNAELPQFFIHA